ncbi:structural maintenance of chromosomes protein 2-like isoform X2 [Ptychodera flava]|uniref:structural maintenance of chromosomes protein 2-like isoform X2 n=1 Tax=Ptychodera flava TaxID=63121 RepID=UPI00396AA0A0
MESEDKPTKSSLVFKSKNLKELKDGLCAVLDVFDSVLELDPENQTRLGCIEINERLQRVMKVTREQQLLQEMKQLQQELMNTNRDMASVKWKYDEKTKELNTLKGSLYAVHQQLKDKQDIITQLKKDGTVQLWEKEKGKLLDHVGKREKELEEELKDWKNMHEETKRRLQDKIRELDHKVKMEKITSEVKMKPNAIGTNAENDSLKRQLYMKEKSLLNAEQELHRQQRLYVGCLIGLQRDFKVMVERQEQKDRLSSKDVRKYQDLLQAILGGSKAGKLESLRADLPDHYLYSGNEVFGHPLGKKLSPIYKNGQIQPIQKKIKGLDDTESVPSDSEISGSESVDIDNRELKRKNPSTTPHIHPELIDKDGKLDIVETKKYYPILTEDQIREQFDNFCQYDTSGDYSLDMSEMTHAMQATIGNYYTPAQIREAMLEVDVDSSDSIDFYEYLGVSVMLRKRAGKSAVFKSGLVKHAGNSVSKMCIVQ